LTQTFALASKTIPSGQVPGGSTQAPVLSRIRGAMQAGAASAGAACCAGITIPGRATAGASTEAGGRTIAGIACAGGGVDATVRTWSLRGPASTGPGV
jgi:hypothetical protein